MSHEHQQQPRYTIEPISAETVDAATRMRLQLWLDTYVNDEAGVTREWIEARNAAQLTPEKMQQRRERLTSPNSAGWVALDGTGEVIGATTPFREEDGTQHVGSMYVAKEWHGTGVSSALMQKVIEWADPTQPIVLGVVTYNERAKAFYRKWGFVEVPDSGMLFDNKIPEVKMVRKGDKQ